MADDVTVDNGTLTDYNVRSTEVAGNKQIQHVRIDVGAGSTESVAAGALPVSGTVTANVGTIAGLATAANQLPDGHNVTISGSATVSGTVTANAGTNLNTSALALEAGNLATIAGKDFATQTTLAALDAKVTAVNTGAVVVSSSALPSGAATAALQLPNSHDVTIDNAAGASAVNIQDGGNSITVDGSVSITGTVAATQSGTWNINNVSGTVSLPTGAATLAEQQTQTASLSVLDDWDESDRAKVNTKVSTGTPSVSSVTTIGTTASLSLTSEPCAFLEISGTYSSISLTFEARAIGGSTYQAIKGYDTFAESYGTTTTVLSSAQRRFYFNTEGYDSIQCRVLGYVSGTMNTRWIPVNTNGPFNASYVLNVLSAQIAGASFAESIGNSPPGDAAQIGFSDQSLGDFQALYGNDNAAWVALRDDVGSALYPLQSYTSIGTGSKNVTTAGTRVTLASSTVCKKVEICAKSTNTGVIWVGGSTVAANSGIPLVAYQRYDIYIKDLSTVYIDSTVNGEGVTFTYYN